MTQTLARKLALAAALSLSLSACASVRSVSRDVRNTDQVGETAPPLEGGTWVVPDELDETDVEVAEWKLLVVFRPD